MENKPREVYENINIKLANIQGLTQEKFTALEEEYLGKAGEYNIVCLTETQKTIENNKIRMGENLVSYNAMRQKGSEKKGGGLMLIHRKNKRINFEKVENKNKNILELEKKAMELKQG